MAAVMGRDELQPMLDLGVVLIGFAAIMIAAGIRMLGEQVPVGGDCALPGGGVDWRGCLPKAIGSGLAVGFLTGLFGVGRRLPDHPRTHPPPSPTCTWATARTCDVTARAARTGQYR